MRSMPAEFLTDEDEIRAMESAALAWAGRSMTDGEVCALASRAIGRLSRQACVAGGGAC